MKKVCLVLLCLISTSAWPVGSGQEPAKKDTPAKTAGKKEPGVMEKTGKTVKSGWNKFTHDVRQPAKKPTCTDAQRSMKQCK